MQQTTNYALKKIELIDSPPDITVINPNWDTIDTELKENEDALTSHKADYMAHGEVASLYRTTKDANNVFTVLEWNRPSGTRFKRSVVSGGTSPKYTRRTVTYYADNGTTVIATKVYTLTYTGDDLTSEVLQ